MNVAISRDEITVALKKLSANTSPDMRRATLLYIGGELKNQLRDSISKELQYDGSPMRSPSARPRSDGKFAESYKWRYLPGYKGLDRVEKKALKAGTLRRKIRRTTFVSFYDQSTGALGGKSGERLQVRRRIPVTGASKQLQFTGGFIKSIDILSGDSQKVSVGPKTGHGNAIASFHGETRRPLGISPKFADYAREIALRFIMKGV